MILWLRKETPELLSVERGK